MSAVIQVVQKLAPGGLEILTTSLSSRLASRESIFSLEGNHQQLSSQWAHLRSLKTEFVSFEKNEGLQFGLLRKIFACFRKDKPRAVITHHIGPLLYAGIAARFAGVKTIIHVEHDGWHLKSKKRTLIERLALLIVRPKLVAVSQHVALELNRIGIDNLHVIYNGVDLQKFSPRSKNTAREFFKLPQDVNIIGASGRLEHVKGHDLLIQAFAQLHFPCHLAIAGNGSQMEKLKALATQLGVEKRVHFLGHIEDTAKFYAALDTFVLPSRNEGLPLSLLEAQACGIRAVAFDVGGVSEGMCQKTGELVKENDVDALAEAIKHIHQWKNIQSPRDYIFKNFNINDTVIGFRQLIWKGLDK